VAELLLANLLETAITGTSHSSYIKANDTCSRNRRHKPTLHFSAAGFWYVCHANPAPDSCGTRFRRRLQFTRTLFYPSQKVMCTWLKGWIYVWSMINW